MSSLLPDGISHLGDAPYTLHQAITQALRILNYEEFPRDERPPKRIWFDGERLTAHWQRVEKARDEKYGTKTDEPEGPSEDNAVELLTRA